VKASATVAPSSAPAPVSSSQLILIPCHKQHCRSIYLHYEGQSDVLLHWTKDFNIITMVEFCSVICTKYMETRLQSPHLVIMYEKLCSRMKEIQPELGKLHNMGGYKCNYPRLQVSSQCQTQYLCLSKWSYGSILQAPGLAAWTLPDISPKCPGGIIDYIL